MNQTHNLECKTLINNICNCNTHHVWQPQLYLFSTQPNKCLHTLVISVSLWLSSYQNILAEWRVQSRVNNVHNNCLIRDRSIKYFHIEMKYKKWLVIQPVLTAFLSTYQPTPKQFACIDKVTNCSFHLYGIHSH